MEFILFFFFPPAKKEERNPNHIAHIGKAPRANAQTKALPKSAILPTHHYYYGTLLHFFIICEKRLKKLEL
jgi:hypothetical protein